jgi:hypothetical protein
MKVAGWNHFSVHSTFVTLLEESSICLGYRYKGKASSSTERRATVILTAHALKSQEEGAERPPLYLPQDSPDGLGNGDNFRHCRPAICVEYKEHITSRPASRRLIESSSSASIICSKGETFTLRSFGKIEGRRPGSRTKLGEAFVADLCADWEKHGIETIARVREQRPHEYLKVVAYVTGCSAR